MGPWCLRVEVLRSKILNLSVWLAKDATTGTGPCAKMCLLPPLHMALFCLPRGLVSAPLFYLRKSQADNVKQRNVPSWRRQVLPQNLSLLQSCLRGSWVWFAGSAGRVTHAILHWDELFRKALVNFCMDEAATVNVFILWAVCSSEQAQLVQMKGKLPNVISSLPASLLCILFPCSRKSYVESRTGESAVVVMGFRNLKHAEFGTAYLIEAEQSADQLLILM